MFKNARIFDLVSLIALVVLCVPVFGADGEDPAGADKAVHHAGFFERNYILTELIVMPIFALLLAGAMASDTTTQRIETTHWDFWNKPLGKSYTDIPVPKEPSSPQEIKNTLIALGVIYVILRLTCLSGCFSAIFQLLGSFIDITLGC